MNRKELTADLNAHIKEFPHSAKSQGVARHGIPIAIDREIMYEIYDNLNQLKLRNYPKHPELKALLTEARETTKKALDALNEKFWS